MTEGGNPLAVTKRLRPSVLDYIAQAGLNSLFDPILRRAVHRLADHSQHFNVLREWFDECFALFSGLVEYHCLKKYAATFSEKFYGLQRVPIGGGVKLGKKELLLSLFAEAVYPYLFTKLRKSADTIIFDELPRTSGSQKWKIMLMKCVIYLNNGLNILRSLLTFVQLLLYLGEKRDYMCPAHWIAGVKLVYSNETLFQEIGFKNIVPNFVARSVELIAFLAQFFHLWKESDKGDLNSVPVPPPPKKIPKATSLSSKCPICLKPRKIDTVLTVSGFVFCFGCITNYVTQFYQCPVTKLPATVDNLVRVRMTS